MSIVLSTTIALTALMAPAPFGDEGAAFDAPVELTGGGEQFSKMVYPTPILYDIDQDDVRELVIGDLFGRMFSCEPGENALAWDAKQNLTSEGKPLKLNNW